MSRHRRIGSWRRVAFAAGVAAALLCVSGVAAAGDAEAEPITTVAGTGEPGFSGDGGRSTSARLNFPTGIAVSAAGNLFIADRDNNRVRMVSPDGVITTVAGTGAAGFSGDGGPAASAQLKHPSAVAVDSAGNLYIADRGNNRVRMVSPDGVITTVAGTGVAGFSGDGGPATSAQLNYPFGLALDAAGNLYIADWGNNRVRRVSPAGVITTVAGTGVAGFSGDGGPATSAELDEPFGVAVDAAGNLYIADTDNHRVRRVSPGGVISTVAGTGVAGFSGDGGPATSAELNTPEGVAVDAVGNLYVTEYFNHRVRRVSAAGVIATVAGTGAAGFSGDGGPATSASLDYPIGVAVDSAGNVLVADHANQRVRSVVGLAPPAGPGEAGVVNTLVEASLVRASSYRGAAGVRTVRVELEVGEPLSVTLTLLRKKETLVTRRYEAVEPGRRTLTLSVPKWVWKTRGTRVRVEFQDAAGNVLVVTRIVKIPALPTRFPFRPAADSEAWAPARSALPTAVCGTFRAAGATWGAKTTGVSCATAKRIVRRLAGKTAPLPGGRYPGRYAGMTCGGVLPGQKPKIITCTGERRQIVAGRKA